MKVMGYCTSCRKVKYVTVSNAGLARMMTRGGVAEGVCDTCGDREEKERRERRCNPRRF